MAKKKITTEKQVEEPVNPVISDEYEVGELEKEIVLEYAKNINDRIGAVVRQCRIDIDNALQPLKTFANQNDLNIDVCEVNEKDGLNINVVFKMPDLTKKYKTQAIRAHLEKVRNVSS